jgi:hypothetical protein
VRKKTGQVEKGASRREGNQTLRAERSGQATPATSGPFQPECAVGRQSPREESRPALEATRFGSCALDGGPTRRKDKSNSFKRLRLMFVVAKTAKPGLR